MRAWIGYVLIGLAAVGLLIGVRHDTVSDREAARKHYIESAHADALGAAGDVEDKLRAIYENLRTLTFLPSVREIDRHGTNLSEEARATIQQIYNNLASNVAVSEVYIVPASLDPERIDPVTGKPEEPILMFDELIVNAGSRVPVSELRQSRPAEFASAPEVEIFEYRQLKQQLDDWTTCVSAKTTKGQAEIQRLSAELGGAESRAHRLAASEPQASPASASHSIDVWA